MPRFAVLRSSLVAGGAVTSLAVAAALAPAALAGEKASPPGLSAGSLPDGAAMHAVPRTDPHGRKLR